MKVIAPEGVSPFIYYAHGEPLPQDNDIVCGFRAAYVDQFPYMRRNIDRLLNVRFVLIPTVVRKGQANAHYLYWETTDETAEIDQLVVEGCYIDADFEKSVCAFYSPHICFGCQRRWHTLVFDMDGGLYRGVKGLWEKKVAPIQLKPCPACGTLPRRFVLMYMEEMLESDPAYPK